MATTRTRPGATVTPRRHKQYLEVGTVHAWDYQSDVFEGEYEIVAFHAETGEYTARHLEPSDELIAKATEHYLTSEGVYLDYVDPFGPGRRLATRQEALDMDILERIEKAGTEFRLGRAISPQVYAGMF